MTVKDTIDMAKFGELRNLKLGQNEDEAILSYIRLGLVELYKRFPLKIEETVVTLNDAQSIYPLPADCMWIIAAYGEVDEMQPQLQINELDINNEDNPLSINTIGWNQIQVPISLNDSYISLIYAAGPDLSTLVYDAQNVFYTAAIPLPMQLMEPLLHYIGYRAHGAMDGSIQAESNTHYMRFDASCKRIQTEGMLTGDNVDMPHRLNGRGFV